MIQTDSQSKRRKGAPPYRAHIYFPLKETVTKAKNSALI
jgi:hypothetical protein